MSRTQDTLAPGAPARESAEAVRAASAQAYMHETWRRSNLAWTLEAFAAGAADRAPLPSPTATGPRCRIEGCREFVEWAGTGRPPHRCPTHQTTIDRTRRRTYQNKLARLRRAVSKEAGDAAA